MCSLHLRSYKVHEKRSLFSSFHVFGPQSRSRSGLVASWVLTHLYGAAVSTHRWHTGQSGRTLCQRRGRGSPARGMKGNGERCATARSPESGQRAESLQNAHKPGWKTTHKHMQTHTQTLKLFRPSCVRVVGKFESTVVIRLMLFGHFFPYWSVLHCIIRAAALDYRSGKCLPVTTTDLNQDML